MQVIIDALATITCGLITPRRDNAQHNANIQHRPPNSQLVNGVAEMPPGHPLTNDNQPSKIGAIFSQPQPNTDAATTSAEIWHPDVKQHLDQGKYDWAAEAAFTAGKDDQVVRVLRLTPPPFPETKNWDNQFRKVWGSLRSDLPVIQDTDWPRAQHLLEKCCDFMLDELPQRPEMTPERLGKILQDLVTNCLPQGRDPLSYHGFKIVPHRLYALCDTQPSERVLQIYKSMQRWCQRLKCPEEGATNLVPPDLDATLARLTVKAKALDRLVMLKEGGGGQIRLFPDLQHYIDQGKNEEAAATRMLEIWFMRRPDTGIPVKRELTYTLDLSKLDLPAPPPHLERLPWLRTLDLSNNKLTTIPDALRNLKHRDEDTRGTRIRIDLRNNNPLRLTRAEYNQLMDPHRTTGPVFVLSPEAEPLEGKPWYEVLGVAPDAPLSEIRHARNRMALDRHTDKLRDVPEDDIKWINAAYDEAKAEREDLQ